ncbi:apt-9 [Pristionchus pacificus]|uniref:Apt-9 n=1 Tax=Pristionchus pacificus TaxID=54126 RepID=A0A2A6D0W2_PRIPA|nr:apt-9 [Pristionchus pacificus]|eukprot:PDM84045.1 apt-9 [Pristionchus pacificus]
MNADVETSRPVEYYISRSTDPFLDEEQRVIAALSLCEKVNDEAEAAQIAVNILAHRILTPNQDEAFFVLQTIEALAQRCGAKVHTKIGKYRFLNQMVKLISPKHQGSLTSEKVREKTIALLFVWQKQMRHIEKFKEVYDNLREHNVIRSDPEVEEDAILSVPPPPPKLAPFEDEEKSQLLKHLLKSTNPDDLQAANRLIKTLVKTEDMKVEKASKRQDDMDKARRACECMEHLLFHPRVNTVHQGEVKCVFEGLIGIRPVLFKYAGEAAETNDEILAEILSLNDQVNRLIQRYQRIFEGKHNEEEPDLLGGELSLEEEITGLSSTEEPALLDDVAFIGIDYNKSMSPSQKDVLSDLSSLLDVAPLFSKPIQNEASTSLSSFATMIFPLENVLLASSPPIEIISSPTTRIYLHMTTNAPPPATKAAVVTLINLSDSAFSFSLDFTPRNKSVLTRLLVSSPLQLFPFKIGSIPHSHQILLFSSQDSRVTSCEIDVKVTYSNPIGITTHHEGSFRVQL